MRELASSVISYTLANVLYTGQQVAKFSGVSESLVKPKNPPAPGSTGEDPKTISAYLYKKTKETAEKFGDPAAVAFIAVLDKDRPNAFFKHLHARRIERDRRGGPQPKTHHKPTKRNRKGPGD